MTVVVTPLIGLEGDLVRRGSDIGLDSVLYRRETPGRAKVVVVVTETTGSGNDFRRCIMDLQTEGKLERIVWDEAGLKNILGLIFVGFRIDSPYKAVTLVSRNLPLRQRLFLLQQAHKVTGQQ